MPTLHLDLVRESELDVTLQSGAYVRTGYIDGIDLADTPDPDALVKCLPYLPPFRSALGPRSTNMLLSRIRVRPEVSKVKRANVWLTYETTWADFTPTAYILRDRTFDLDYEGFFLPGTRKLVQVSFDPATIPGATTADKALTKINSQPVLFRSTYSARSVQLTTIMYGRPSTTIGDYHNYVNNAPWPNATDITIFGVGTNNVANFNQIINTSVKTAKQYAKGFWRVNAYSTEYDRNKGMTMASGEAITKGLEDWSQVVILRDEKTGKYPFASLSDGVRFGILSAMAARTYDQDILYPVGSDPQAGITRFGEHPLVSFPTLWGF